MYVVCMYVCMHLCMYFQKAECWRSAVDLTCRLLVQCGQGPNRGNQPAILTPFCLQVKLSKALFYCLIPKAYKEKVCQGPLNLH